MLLICVGCVWVGWCLCPSSALCQSASGGRPVSTEFLRGRRYLDLGLTRRGGSCSCRSVRTSCESAYFGPVFVHVMVVLAGTRVGENGAQGPTRLCANLPSRVLLVVVRLVAACPWVEDPVLVQFPCFWTCSENVAGLPWFVAAFRPVRTRSRSVSASDGRSVRTACRDETFRC